MPLIDPLPEIHAAKAGRYALGAFNMHNEETTEALLWAAEQANAPVILQIGEAIIPHMGIERAFEMTKRIAERSSAKYVIHLDHGRWEQVLSAIKLGFNSIMYDGSHLPFEENIAKTRQIVEICHEFGIPVEAELGRIPDAGEQVNWDDYYTEVAEAEKFAKETGIDTLAISVGIVHGVAAGKPQPLDIPRIEKIRDATGIPLVLHGASGIPEDQVIAAREAGVHKFNADTDLRHAFRAGIEAVWSQGDRQLEDAMAEGRTRMVAATIQKMELYGCAAKASRAAA